MVARAPFSASAKVRFPEQEVSRQLKIGRRGGLHTLCRKTINSTFSLYLTYYNFRCNRCYLYFTLIHLSLGDFTGGYREVAHFERLVRRPLGLPTFIRDWVFPLEFVPPPAEPAIFEIYNGLPDEVVRSETIVVVQLHTHTQPLIF